MEIEQADRIAYLLSRHITDTLSSEEHTELERWLALDIKNQELWRKVCRRGFYSEKEMLQYLYDDEAAFRKVQIRCHRRLFRERMFRWGGMAAVIVVVVGVSLLWMCLSRSVELPGDDRVQLTAGESQAILILGHGQRIELNCQVKDSIIPGTQVRLNISGEVIDYRQESAGGSEMDFNIVEVPRKGEYRLILSDGTKVWLNSESRLKFPVAFYGRERRVYLEGEAYFEVSENKDMPFIVDMSKAAVKVLGTSFNARAYPDESCIYATLAEGRILLDAGGQNLVLQPQEQGVLELVSGKMTCKKVDVTLYSGWKDGRFIFQEQTLENMMNTLSRWYDIQIFFESEAVRRMTFSGNLKRYDSFNKIIELLEMTGMAHFKINGKTILISE